MLVKDAILSINAYQIFDSRGKPTVEASLKSKDGKIFRAAVPSGASTGIYEAVELRDNIKADYLGVSKAIENVNKIIWPQLLTSDLSILDQNLVDQFLINLDGTPNKGKLGANSILAVSMVISRFAASLQKIELYEYLRQLANVEKPRSPLPFLNIINGGVHAGNMLAFQEFMIVPTAAATFQEAMKIGSEIYQNLKILIKAKHGIDAINVGDEGGFAPPVKDPRDCLDLLMQAIESAGHNGKVSIALDVAASEFHLQSKPGYYNLDIKNPNATVPNILSGKDLANLYLDLVDNYPIVSIEDPFDQDDWESWIFLRQVLPDRVQVVGDDLTVSNPQRVQSAIEKKACNALLLKINQIGTISESIEAARLAMSHGWHVMVSHRSGETEDDYIADLSIGLGCGQLKSGAPCRSERLSKYNRILRVANDFGVDL